MKKYYVIGTHPKMSCFLLTLRPETMETCNRLIAGQKKLVFPNPDLRVNFDYEICTYDKQMQAFYGIGEGEVGLHKPTRFPYTEDAWNAAVARDFEDDA